MKPPLVRTTFGWALCIAGIALLILSFQDGVPYMKASLLGLTSCSVGLFLLMQPTGKARTVALVSGILAYALISAVILSFEKGVWLGSALIDIVVAVFLGSLGVSLFATTRHVFFSQKIPGLEPGKKIRG